MIQWTIKHNDIELEIETGPVTILKSTSNHWFRLVRSINDYFEVKQSLVEIFQDNLPLYKKDWECLFIPYDAQLDFQKFTSKSPLKPVVDELVNRISMSPALHALTEVWQELNEELHIISDDLDRFELKANLLPLSEDDLKKFISISSVHSIMTPIHFKLMLLDLFVDKTMEKNRLVIIELPEIYCEHDEFLSFKAKIQSYAEQGIKFIIVTQEHMVGNVNFLYRNVVINDAAFEVIKQKVINALPFVCDERLFIKAKDTLIRAVDNSLDLDDLITEMVNLDEALATVITVITKELNIPLSLDTTSFSPNIKTFLDAS